MAKVSNNPANYALIPGRLSFLPWYRFRKVTGCPFARLTLVLKVSSLA